MNLPCLTVKRAAAVRSLALVSALAIGACAPAAGPPAVTPPPVTAQSAGDTMSLVLLGTTDVHGYIHNYDYYSGRETSYGLALLKPLVDSIRSAHPKRTLLFDSGDLLQGNPLPRYERGSETEPNPVIRAMNFMDYDAAAIGNHEFNYGLPNLARAVEQADFPFVTANIFRAGTTEHAYRPFALIPMATPTGDTLIVGVTGNTPPGVHVWDRDNVSGVLELRDVVSSVGAVVREMRTRGADVVVVLSHGGLEGTSYDTVTTGLPAENAAAALARAVPEIDVIFLGHTHRELADTTINGVLLTQAKNWATSLAAVTLTAQQTAPDAWRVIAKRGEIVRPRGEPDRALLDTVRWEHERTVSRVNAVIGRATEAMPAREGRVRDVPVIDFINEVQRRVSGAQLSATAAFSISAGLPAGELTVADVAALYPYDNTLRAIRISGAQLRAYLEKSAQYYRGWPASGGTVTDTTVPGYNFDIVSGVEYTIDISRPVGQRVTSLTYEGAPVRDDQSFTMALNNYRQSGGGGFGMIASAEIVYDRQEDIRELLIEEVRRRGEIRPADYFTQSWRLVPEAAAAAALAEQTRREIAPASPSVSGAAERKRLRVLSTNDFHGNLETQTPSWAQGRRVGGAAVLARYFGLEAEAFDGPTIILDGGDIMQGTPVSNLTRGRSSVEYYNMVRYRGAALGNHEFDWGSPVLRERMAQAEYPWLAANILVTGSDTTPSWVRPTAMIEVDGVRVGLIGLTTEETPETTHANNVSGLTFADGGPIIDRYVPQLRAQGADFVIVVAHAGAECEADAVTCEGELIDWVASVRNKPDLVIGGHTNAIMRTYVNGIALQESANYGWRYGVADLERVNADSVDVWFRGTPAAWEDRVTPDSSVAALVARAIEEIGPQVSRRIGTAAREIQRGQAPPALGNLIADAQRAVTDAQVAIMNIGGVRAPIEAGPVTWGDLYRVHPFGNLLMVLRLRGADLRSALEHGLRGDAPNIYISGATVRYDSSRPVGSRVLSITLADGTTVTDDAVYVVTVNDFLANGIGDGFTAFGRSLEQRPTGIADLDALITHVQSLPQPFDAPREQRFIDVSGN